METVEKNAFKNETDCNSELWWSKYIYYS